MAEYRTVTAVAQVSRSVFNADGSVSKTIINVTADGQRVVVVDPYIEIEQTDEGAVITVTDTRGSTEATIYNGEKGDTGATPDFSIGTVTTGEPGTSAAATITGTAEEPVLNLTIPRGDPGDSVDIFWATFYTTYAELEAAYQAGKTILLRVWDIPYIHYLTLHNDSKFVFAAVFQGPIESASIAVSYAVCNSTDGWLPTEVRMTSFDYEDLWNLPSINGVTLTGDKSASDLGLAEPVFGRGTGEGSAVLINTTDDDPCVASGISSMAGGVISQATGAGSFAFGQKVTGTSTAATGNGSAAFGGGATASGTFSFAHGQKPVASGPISAAFGNYTKASGRSSFVVGQANIEDTNPVDTAHGAGARKYIFTVGNGLNDSNRSNALTVDWDGNLVASGKMTAGAAPAADMDVATKQYVDQSTFFEAGTGQYSTQRIMPSGSENNASGHLSVALGANSIASGTASFAHGIKLRDAPPTTASGDQSVAIGGAAVASGLRSQAFGQVTVASGSYSTAIGNQTTAAGNSSQAFGQGTATTAPMSSAFGNYTIASGRACFVAGQYNVEDTNPVDTTHGGSARKYIAIIGNGTAENARSNALTVDWDGNEVLAGKLTVGAAPTESMDVATKQYVDENAPQSNWLEDDSSDPAYIQNKPPIKAGTNTYSAVLGDIDNNVASGFGSFAGGEKNRALGRHSVAFGFNNLSFGRSSFVLGDINRATQARSFTNGVATVNRSAINMATAHYGYIQGGATQTMILGGGAGGYLNITGAANATTYEYDQIPENIQEIIDGRQLMLIRFDDPIYEIAMVSAIDTNAKTITVDATLSDTALENYSVYLAVTIAARHPNSVAMGTCLETARDHQFIFGAVNELDPDAMFILANGDTTHASNAMSVYDDGSAKFSATVSAGTALNPAAVVRGNDLTTKSYVDTEIASIDAEDVGLTPISAVAIEAILQS